MYVFKEPKEFAFIKVGIKGKKILTQHLGKNSGFTIITTDKGHETTII